MNYVALRDHHNWIARMKTHKVLVIQEYLLSFPEKWTSLLRDEWLSGSSAAASIWLPQGVCVPAPLPLTESGVEAF